MGSEGTERGADSAGADVPESGVEAGIFGSASSGSGFFSGSASVGPASGSEGNGGRGSASTGLGPGTSGLCQGVLPGRPGSATARGCGLGTSGPGTGAEGGERTGGRVGTKEGPVFNGGMGRAKGSAGDSGRADSEDSRGRRSADGIRSRVGDNGRSSIRAGICLGGGQKMGKCQRIAKQRKAG